MPVDTETESPEKEQPNEQPKEPIVETTDPVIPPDGPTAQIGTSNPEKVKTVLRVDQQDPSPDAQLLPPHLHMELEDSEIMGMDIQTICRDLELVNRGLAEFNRQHFTLVQRKAQITKKMEEISKRSAMLGKVQLILQRTQKENPNDGIRRFQQRSMEQRQKRKENALAFINKGTNPKAIKELLTTKSPIDQGLEGRKPGIGQGRPGQRIPARV